MKIARCTPSRGLIHSRTEETAEWGRMYAEAQEYVWRSFFSHDLPIPGCFNAVCEEAYLWGADLFWILEEDVRPALYAFSEMFETIASNEADVAVVDYPMDDPGSGKISWGVIRDGAGQIAWARTGCILFKRACLEALPKPWFSTRGRLVEPGTVTWQGPETGGYGCDIGFTHQLTQLGFRFVEVEAICDHLRVVEMGQRGVNAGCHHVEALPAPEREPTTPPRRAINGSFDR